MVFGNEFINKNWHCLCTCIDIDNIRLSLIPNYNEKKIIEN